MPPAGGAGEWGTQVALEKGEPKWAKAPHSVLTRLGLGLPSQPPAQGGSHSVMVHNLRGILERKAVRRAPGPPGAAPCGAVQAAGVRTYQDLGLSEPLAAHGAGEAQSEGAGEERALLAAHGPAGADSEGARQAEVQQGQQQHLQQVGARVRKATQWRHEAMNAKLPPTRRQRRLGRSSSWDSEEERGQGSQGVGQLVGQRRGRGAGQRRGGRAGQRRGGRGVQRRQLQRWARPRARGASLPAEGRVGKHAPARRRAADVS